MTTLEYLNAQTGITEKLTPEHIYPGAIDYFMNMYNNSKQKKGAILQINKGLATCVIKTKETEDGGTITASIVKHGEAIPIITTVYSKSNLEPFKVLLALATKRQELLVVPRVPYIADYTHLVSESHTKGAKILRDTMSIIALNALCGEEIEALKASYEAEDTVHFGE